MDDDDEDFDDQTFRNQLIGYSYQLKLLLLFLSRGWKNDYIFELCTEVKEAQKFDDIVFYFKNKDEKNLQCLCLQAKHSLNHDFLKYDDFLKNKTCNLRRYFASFRIITQQCAMMFPENFVLSVGYRMPETRKLNKNNGDALIFELIPTKESDVIDKIFYNSSEPVKEKWECFRMTHINSEAIKMLESATNLKLLAKNLVLSIINNEKTGQPEPNHVNLENTNFWFSVYKSALINDKVLEQGTTLTQYKFTDIFLKDGIDSLRDFRTAVFEEYKNYLTKEKNKKCQKNDPKNKPVDKSFTKLQQKYFTFVDKKEEVISEATNNIVQYILNGTVLNDKIFKISALAEFMIMLFYDIFEVELDNANVIRLKEAIVNDFDKLPEDAKKFMQNLKTAAMNKLMEFKIGLIPLSKLATENHEWFTLKMDLLAKEIRNTIEDSKKLAKILKCDDLETTKMLTDYGGEVFEISSNELKFKKIFFCGNETLSEKAQLLLKQLKIHFNNDVCHLNEYTIQLQPNKLPEKEKIIFDFSAAHKVVVEIENMIDKSNVKSQFLKYDREKSNENNTQGLLDAILPEVFLPARFMFKKTFLSSSEGFSENAKMLWDELKNIFKEKAKSLFKYQIELPSSYNLKKDNTVTKIEKKHIIAFAEEIKNVFDKLISPSKILNCGKSKTFCEIFDVLYNEVFDVTLFKFKNEFIKSDTELSLEATMFRKKLFENSDESNILNLKELKKLKITVPPFKTSLFDQRNIKQSEERISKFVEGFMDFIDTCKNNKAGIYNQENYSDIAFILPTLTGTIFERCRNENNMLKFKEFTDDEYSKIFKAQLTNAVLRNVIINFNKKNVEMLNIPLFCITQKRDIIVQNLVNAIKNAEKKDVDLTLNINHDTKNLLTELCGKAFVSTGELNKIKFKSTFLSCDKWSKDAEEFRHYLKNGLKKVENYEKLKSFKIQIIDDSTTTSVVPERGIPFELADSISRAILENKSETTINILKYGTDTTETLQLKALTEVLFEIENNENNYCKLKTYFFECDEWSFIVECFRHKLKENIFPDILDNLNNSVYTVKDCPFSCEALIENGDIKADIEEFRKRFIIATTPGEVELIEIIGKELGQKFHLLNSNTVTNAMYIEVINWAKNMETKPMTDVEANLFFHQINAEISCIAIAGLPLLYRGILKSYNLHFMNIDVSLKSFFINEQKVLILRSNCIILTAIKVEQLIPTRYKNLDSLIFHTLSSLMILENFKNDDEDKEKRITSALATKSEKTIIIVDDLKSKNSEAIIFLETVKHIIQKNENKKLIFITENLNPSLFVSDAEVDDNKFADLEQESQKALLGRKVTFQGKLMRLHKIIDDFGFWRQKMDIQLLKLLVQDEKPVIAEPIESAKGFDKIYYCERKIGPIKIDKKFFKKTQRRKDILYYFEGINDKDFLTMLKDIDSATLHQAGNLFYNKLDVAYLTEFVKANNIKCLIHFVTEEEETPEETVKKFYIDVAGFIQLVSEERAVLIVDSAGMGKSTVLSSLVQKMADYVEVRWKVRINLLSQTYIKMLEKVNAEKFPEDSDFCLNFSNKDYGTVVLSSLKPSEKHDEKDKTIENHIFEYLFNHDKVVIMFDGFDELEFKHRNLLTNFFQKLKEKNQIWISSRTNYKQQLEDSLEASAYSMKPLSDEQQHAVLINIWRKKWQKEHKDVLSGIQLIHLKKYAIALIETFEDVLGTNENVAGTPLLTIMLSKMFIENNDEQQSTQKWDGCFDFIKAHKNDTKCYEDCWHRPNFSNKLKNLYNLYENFYDKKTRKYFNRLFASGSTDVSFLKAELKKKLNEFHNILGYRAMNETEEWREWSTKEEKIGVEKYIAEFEDGKHNVGIIDYIGKNGHPTFTHFTFGEYFAARFLIDKLNTFPEKHEIILKIIARILQNDVPVFSYCCKYLICNESKSYDVESIIHDVVAINFQQRVDQVTLVKWYLNNENFDNQLPLIDKENKTLLHYAAEKGLSNVIIHVILHVSFLIAKRLNFLSFAKLKVSMFYLSEFVNLPDNIGHTAIKYAKKEEIIKLLSEITKAGKEIEKPEDYDNNILHILSAKINDRFLFRNYYLPLFSSLSLSSVKLVLASSESTILKIFLNEDDYGFNIFDDFCSREKFTATNMFQIFNYWWESSLTAESVDHFIRAAIANDRQDLFTCIKKFLDKKTYLIDVNKCFVTACITDVFELVEVILPLYSDNNKSNSLHTAIFYSASLKIIDYIIKEKAVDINTNTENETALTLLMKNKRVTIPRIVYFLNKGADVCMTDGSGKTSWDYAFESDDDDIIQCFLEKEISETPTCKNVMKEYYASPKDFNIDFDSDGNSRLIEAICNESTETLVKFLLRKGANVNVESQNGLSPLHHAYTKNCARIIEDLLDNGACYNIKNYEGTIFVSYCKKESEGLLESWIFEVITANKKHVLVEKVKQRIEMGYEISDAMAFSQMDDGYESEQANVKNYTILHLAIQTNSLGSVFQESKNLFRDVYVNKKDLSGKTALHMAAEKCEKNSVFYLLSRGAHYDEPDADGKTPLDLAQNIDVKKLLKNIGELFHIAAHGTLKEFDTLYSDVTDVATENDNQNGAQFFRDKEGKTFLYRALESRNNEVARKIIEISSSDAEIFLFDAIQCNNMEILVEMLKQFAFDNKAYKKMEKDEKNECMLLVNEIVKLFDLVYQEEYNVLLDKLKTEWIQNPQFGIDFKTVINIIDYNSRSLCDYIQRTSHYDFNMFILQDAFLDNIIDNIKLFIFNRKVRRMIVTKKTQSGESKRKFTVLQF